MRANSSAKAWTIRRRLPFAPCDTVSYQSLRVIAMTEDIDEFEAYLNHLAQGSSHARRAGIRGCRPGWVMLLPRKSASRQSRKLIRFMKVGTISRCTVLLSWQSRLTRRSYSGCSGFSGDNDSWHLGDPLECISHDRVVICYRNPEHRCGSSDRGT